MTPELEKAFKFYPPLLQRKYNRLPAAYRRFIDAKFAKHLAACVKIDCGVDPGFLRELVEDTAKGFWV